VERTLTRLTSGERFVTRRREMASDADARFDTLGYTGFKLG
jgi:hypothetical protein